MQRRIVDPDELPMILTPMDIAAILGISRNKAYEYIHTPGFPKFNVGKRSYRVSKKKFLAWLDEESVA